MTGPATYSRDADVAADARAALDRAVERVGSMESAQRSVVDALVELWPSAAWRAAGAASAKAWLLAYTTVSGGDADRLVRVAELCSRDARLAEAVSDGTLPLPGAHTLARRVTPERARFLEPLIGPLLDLVRSTSEHDVFRAAVQHWVDRVDEVLAPRAVQRQSLVVSERLFGGGEIHASLAPVSFQNVCAAIDAFTQDPDPTDAPYRRTLSERRADALDDLSVFALTYGHDDDLHGEDEQIRADDTYDGSYPGDALDEALRPENDGLDDLDIIRARLRRAEQHQRRRECRQTRPRSGVRVNVHIDLRTLSGTRDATDLDDLVLHGDGWQLTQSAAEQMLCDSALVATLFDGKTRILDANTAAERFSKQQRRAIAARDHHCVFPGCQRRPRHCDTHHLEERHLGGPTSVANGCLLCRFHHRLLHQHRWQLARDDAGVWTATDPHGTEWKGRPSRPAAA